MTKTDELLEKIKKLGYTIRQTGYTDQDHADKNIYNYRYWAIPEENYQLRNTPFYHNSEDDFIHFSSLEALFSILNTKHLRLYNLLNMDDKFELDYARKALSFYIPEKEDKEKEHIYSFSMCSSSVILNEEPKKKKHLLWKLHGKDGNGVIIRLKLINDLSLWANFYLARCFYDLENFGYIKELHKITDKEFLDPKVACFIKLPIYDFENEIRLIFDLRNSWRLIDQNGKQTYPIIYPDKLNKSDNISYFQLPLYNFFKDVERGFPTPYGMPKNYEIPKLCITEIILGYRFNDSDCSYLRERISIIDSTINVKLSELKQYY